MRILLQRKYIVGCKLNTVRFNNLFPKLNITSRPDSFALLTDAAQIEHRAGERRREFVLRKHELHEKANGDDAPTQWIDSYFIILTRPLRRFK